MKKHFVTFYSPGTMFAEETSKEIDSWDVNKAIELSKSIVVRYNATPYGFIFSTSESTDWEPRQIAKSPMYYLGGTIKTLEDVESENNPEDHILIQNMRFNGYNRIIENNNSWKSVHPLNDDDIVLQVS